MNREIVRDISQLVIALTLIGGAFYFLAMIFLSGTEVPAALEGSLLQVVGGILALIGIIVGFYFGTSLSSARKDTALSQVATKSTT